MEKELKNDIVRPDGKKVRHKILEGRTKHNDLHNCQPQDYPGKQKDKCIKSLGQNQPCVNLGPNLLFL